MSGQTWKQKIEADTQRYMHLPAYAGQGPVSTETHCCMCGLPLSRFPEGVDTLEDGQQAHLKCSLIPHIYSFERRELRRREEKEAKKAAAKSKKTKF